MSEPFIELRDLRLRYGAGGSEAVLALDGVDMAIGRGEFVAVVGPSGCGKSSLMKVVTGLLPPSHGEVRVGGEAVRAPIKIVGMAFQNASLLPWRTALENVMLPFEIVRPHRHRLRGHRDDYEGKARALLAAVGLKGFENKLPRQLSGGMQQRTSLCRALIHEPELLMLDEPFAALDAFTREELWGVLQDLWLERKFTVILVTHDLRESVFLSDAVFVMSNRPGRIVTRRAIPRSGRRELPQTYTAEFNAIVHELRDHIGRLRAA
jgi:NitT/TauT family transport system ATP-binding protein